MINNYVVSFELYQQVSENDYEKFRYCLNIDSNTTIVQIEYWIKSKTPGKILVDFEIHKLENL